MEEIVRSRGETVGAQTAEDNSIYALDATAGTILWSFATGALSYSSPIVVNGWLYCGSDDGKLYAFDL